MVRMHGCCLPRAIGIWHDGWEACYHVPGRWSAVRDVFSIINLIRVIDGESKVDTPLPGAGSQIYPKIFGPGVPRHWARRTPTLGQVYPDTVKRLHLTAYP